MQDVFVGRQPIYDKKLDVVAYELLFRGWGHDQAASLGGDSATGRVLLNTLINIGLENLVGDRLAFINFTRRFLTEPDGLPFDNKRIALELLESIEPDAEFVEAVRKFSQEGFCIVLDDFVYAEKYRELVELADIVKIDFRALNSKQLKDEVQTLRKWGVKQLLAEKIETLDEFKYCLQLGFDLYQGYFLSRPTIVKGKSPLDRHWTTLQLLAKLQSPKVEISELAEIISRDAGLSYKLLRLLNSSAVGLRRKVESIRQAITLLGMRQLRMMATLLSMSGMSNKPQALLQIALMRSNMCELLAIAMQRNDSDSFSIVGLFSTLDAVLDSKLEDVLIPLPITDDVKDALLSFQGLKGEVYHCVIDAERGEWETIECHGLTRPQIYEAYLAAIAATKDAMVNLGQSWQSEPS